MHNEQLYKSARNLIKSLKEQLTTVLRQHESDQLIREIFTVFLLLRWIDMQDAEQNAKATLADHQYHPLLPSSLQWRWWGQLHEPRAIAEQLRQLENYLYGLRDNTEQHSIVAYLRFMAEPVHHIMKMDVACLYDAIRWVDELPFETPSERLMVREIFDLVMGESDVDQFSTPTGIARLMVAIANPEQGERLYDPCFGSANLLIAAWEYAAQGATSTSRTNALLEISGNEINSDQFLTGLVRMLLEGIYNPRITLGDSLESDLYDKLNYQGFDVVLAHPPFGMRIRDQWRYQHFPILTSDSTGLFVQHALSQLKLTGRAVIVVPDGFLSRGGAERELRRNLLEAGHIEAIVGLPAGAFLPYAGTKCSLLVLNKKSRTNRVRMVDAIPFFETRQGRKAPFINDLDIQQLAFELRRSVLSESRSLAFTPSENTIGTAKHTQAIWNVSIDELAAVDWNLSPRRHEKGGLEELLLDLEKAFGESGEVKKLSHVADVTVGRTIKSADLLEQPPVERAMGYIRIKDITNNKVGRCTNWLRPELASIEERWALLSGDILVSKISTIGKAGKAALVRKESAGSLAAHGFYVLRAKQDMLDPSFLLAYFASSACQNWLSSQSSTLAQSQSLNRTVLEQLPIPIPPLHIQARAAAQYRDFGTDALTFLNQATGSNESNRLTNWLADLSEKIPQFVIGIDDTPSLDQFESLVVLAKTVRNWLAHDQIKSQATRWLNPLIYKTLLLLEGVAQIPPGSGLLSVLQDSERGILVVLEQTTGHLPVESQARAIAERLRNWLDASISDLMNSSGLIIQNTPSSLIAGSIAEFSITLANPGVLPLRNIRIDTIPDWGGIQTAYLAERGQLVINLRGNAPKQENKLILQIRWDAQNLASKAVNGDIELAIRVAKPEEHESMPATTELGGSPYVTGSPLEPQYGHDVFFGREGLISQISRQIMTQGNVILLEGNRRAGKTSILKHLEGKTAIPGWLAVYASLQGADGAGQVVGVPTQEVFREIARSIATALTKLGIEVPLPNGNIIAPGKLALGIARACREGIRNDSSFSDFRDYLEVVLAVLTPLKLGLVLMLDEFDKLQEGIDNGVTSPQVPENIRFLIQNNPKFSAILTGSRRLKRLREEYWSALYGLGINIPVTALDLESARKVVIEPVKAKLSFANEAAERIIEITARQPYLMQCVCNRVFDYAAQTNNHSITLNIVNEASQSLVRDNEHFASLWDYAKLGSDSGKQRRQLILLLFAQSFKRGTHINFGTLQEELTQSGIEIYDDALASDLAYLRELELIDFSGTIGNGNYQLAIPLMADWIEQQQDADVVKSHARIEFEEE